MYYLVMKLGQLINKVMGNILENILEDWVLNSGL